VVTQFGKLEPPNTGQEAKGKERKTPKGRERGEQKEGRKKLKKEQKCSCHQALQHLLSTFNLHLTLHANITLYLLASSPLHNPSHLFPLIYLKFSHTLKFSHLLMP
jgi:hypothetical protein